MVVVAAGTLLTLLMAKAMNRSVSNILFTNFGRVVQQKQGEIKGSLKPVEASDAGIFMRYAASVIIVPGYGLAVAQAQQKLYEFVKLLQAAGSRSSSRSIQWRGECPARWMSCWPRQGPL